MENNHTLSKSSHVSEIAYSYVLATPSSVSPPIRCSYLTVRCYMTKIQFGRTLGLD